ncbi:hypothetical protein L1285_19210 [Pseudoalteromonas sp. DL2-H2.2]|uniref:hypothetical protein n=1 Tax=Pseudoalteromonas sp. DL2-H2.2 TaxID=2908889 RepID=UPI001F24BF81|nr:hypothetical protein [Pseudoalteromonas sp. DL2-H2.2]MCF2910445.1 hypothetical protein [Pseudoalteromonas sp. DL2-H2.2]
MITLKKTVMKRLVAEEFTPAMTKDVAGGHDFQPSAFRGCQSNETREQFPV